MLAYGDAIGNHVMALKRVIQGMGISTDIYAETIDERLPAGTGMLLSALGNLRREDIIIYHLCFESALNLFLMKWKCRRILMYHNITPPRFFVPYDSVLAEAFANGLRQTEAMAGDVECCIAMSEFNKRDLVAMGYCAEKIWVMPGYLFPVNAYAEPPDEGILKWFGDGWHNILFVGRIAPNKKHEDVIRAFAYYKRHVHAKSRLIFVGSTAVPAYAEVIRKYIDGLNLSDVVFSGHVSTRTLNAFYRVSHVFLCMSEHEGFCVPLIEAMYFGLPVIAYRAAAIPETMAGCGLVLSGKDPVEVSLCIDLLMRDTRLRDMVVSAQKKRLEWYDSEIIKESFIEFLSRFT